MLRIQRLALFIEPPDLAVGEAKQSLYGHAAFHAALTQRLDQCAHHPPQLEQCLGGCDLFKAGGNGSDALEMVVNPFAAYPADQPHLEARAQLARPLHHRQVLFATVPATAVRPAGPSAD